MIANNLPWEMIAKIITEDLNLSELDIGFDKLKLLPVHPNELKAEYNVICGLTML